MSRVAREAAHRRASEDGLARSRPADDPELIAARRDLTVHSLATHVARVVAAAPPLTPEQLDELARLLKAPAESGQVA